MEVLMVVSNVEAFKSPIARPSALCLSLCVSNMWNAALGAVSQAIDVYASIGGGYKPGACVIR